MKDSILMIKAYSFALDIIGICRFQIQEQKEYVLSKQLLKSGTAIGALIKESEHAESKADFIHKMQISLKEANETEYWLELLKETGYIDFNKYNAAQNKCRELIRLLIKIIKTSKANKLTQT